MYKENPEYMSLIFDPALHETLVADALFNNVDVTSAVIVDRDDIIGFFFRQSDAQRVESQLNMARVAYETLKEIAGAADGLEPYSPEELCDILHPLLNEMQNAGIRGQGEE